jgi:hypothetical protein
MPLNKTLGELRGDLSARLGFGAAGANNGALVSILNNFLYTSQVELYWEYDWRALRVWVEGSVGASQVYVDFPAEIHPERVQWISIQYSNVWTPPLHRGISAEMYTSQDIEGVPTHWDMNSSSGTAQIEFWPQTDAAYDYRVFGMAPLGALSDDSDRTTIDSDLVFLHALAGAKAHYRHPDAGYYTDLFARLMANQANKTWAKRVFNPGDDEGHWLPKPLLVGRDV